jgi:hypothetical protein
MKRWKGRFGLCVHAGQSSRQTGATQAPNACRYQASKGSIGTFGWAIEIDACEAKAKKMAAPQLTIPIAPVGKHGPRSPPAFIDNFHVSPIYGLKYCARIRCSGIRKKWGLKPGHFGCGCIDFRQRCHPRARSARPSGDPSLVDEATESSDSRKKGR